MVIKGFGGWLHDLFETEGQLLVRGWEEVNIMIKRDRLGHFPNNLGQKSANG